MAEIAWMPAPADQLLQATRLSEAYKTDPAMASSAASGNPKRAGLFRRALVQCHLLYYHWEILTAMCVAPLLPRRCVTSRATQVGSLTRPPLLSLRPSRYMLDFWEKSLVNTLCILGMALVTYGLTDGVQRLVAWVGTGDPSVGR